MEKVKPYKKSYSLEDLQAVVRNDDSYYGSLNSLGNYREYTIATYKRGRAEDENIVLIPAPNGTAIAPEGTELVCQGEVYVLGQIQEIAAFRAT